MNAPSRQPASTRGRMPPNSAEIVGQDFEHAADAVAPPDQRGADRDQHADRDHRPADGLADVAGTRFAFRGVGGLRRVV